MEKYKDCIILGEKLVFSGENLHMPPYGAVLNIEPISASLILAERAGNYYFHNLMC